MRFLKCSTPRTTMRNPSSTSPIFSPSWRGSITSPKGKRKRLWSFSISSTELNPLSACLSKKWLKKESTSKMISTMVLSHLSKWLLLSAGLLEQNLGAKLLHNIKKMMSTCSKSFISMKSFTRAFLTRNYSLQKVLLSTSHHTWRLTSIIFLTVIQTKRYSGYLFPS